MKSTCRTTDYISSTLSDQCDVSEARQLQCNTEPQRVFQGQVPGHDAFVLSKSEARDFIAADKRNASVIHPFLIGRDLVSGDGQPTRYVIDFHAMDVLEASAFKLPFQRIQTQVLPSREREAKKGKTAAGGLRPHHQLFLRYWWRHSYDRAEMIRAIGSLTRFIVCSRVTKRPIFEFISPQIRPDSSLFVFAFSDDYSFGVLQSASALALVHYEVLEANRTISLHAAVCL